MPRTQRKIKIPSYGSNSPRLWTNAAFYRTHTVGQMFFWSIFVGTVGIIRPTGHCSQRQMANAGPIDAAMSRNTYSCTPAVGNKAVTVDTKTSTSTTATAAAAATAPIAIGQTWNNVPDVDGGGGCVNCVIIIYR